MYPFFRIQNLVLSRYCIYFSCPVSLCISNYMLVISSVFCSILVALHFSSYILLAFVLTGIYCCPDISFSQ